MAPAFGGETAESYYDEGLTASVRGDLGRASECFEKAIRLDNTMATAYHQLGRCYARLGQHKKAIKLLSQVVQKRPNLVAARLDLGHALNGLGDAPAARRQFEAALEAEPGNAKALLGIAESDAQAGDWEGALRFAELAQNAGGQNYSALLLLGRAAKHMGQAELSVRSLVRADKLIEKYLETNPDKPEGYYLRGEIALEGENDAAALQHYREAEKRAEPGRAYLAYGQSFTMADIVARQAACLQRIGQRDSARDLADVIERLDPEHPALATLRED
jgi:tetratricopeptide (TPR) repeat protein